MTITSAAAIEERMRQRGFSLVEVLMAISLSSFILAGVFSSTLFVTQSGISLQNYYEMEGKYQRMLTRFSRDAWMASDAKWLNPQTLRLETVKGTVEYQFNDSQKILSRKDSSGTIILLSDIASLQFRAFDAGGTEISLQNNLSQANTSTKSTQLIIKASKAVPLGWTNDASMSTARFMLRNKLAN